MANSHPLASVALRFHRRHVLMVFVWPTLKAMRHALQKKSGKVEHKTLGYFHAPITKIKARGVVVNKIVGEIHLTKNRFGAGIFAHELQHFISWWCNVKDLDPMGEHWEYIPKLAGDLTNKFWTWFYDESNLMARPHPCPSPHSGRGRVD